MQSEWVPPGAAAWDECLQTTAHDFYHLPEYVELAANFEGGHPTAFIASDNGNRLFLPLIIRPIPGAEVDHPLQDATSPYGFPSPLIQAPDESSVSEFLSAALDRLMADLRQRGLVSLFLRLHPLLPLPLEPFERGGTLVRHGETVFIDLTATEEDIWHQVRKQFRSRIKRAQRNGCEVHVDANWDYLDDFFDIYSATMRRVDASAYYFFPKAYFEQLRDALGHVFHLAIVRADGAVAGAGIFSERCGMVQAHLCGMRIEYADFDPAKLLMDAMWRWAKERGNRLFHLGGGIGAGSSSLAQFKTGFSKLRGDFHTWRAVIDPQAYGVLLAQWQTLAREQAPDPTEFFPAYRRPITLPTAELTAEMDLWPPVPTALETPNDERPRHAMAP